MLYVCFLNATTLVAGTSADVVREMVAIAGGKTRGAPGARPELAAALRKVEPGSTFFAVAEVDADLRSKLWALTGKWMGEVTHFVVSLRTKDGLDLVWREGLAGKPDAVLRIAASDGLIDLVLRAVRDRIAERGGEGPHGEEPPPAETEDGDTSGGAPLPGPAAHTATGCEAYARCVRALAAAYRAADFPGAADAGAAMEESVAALESMAPSAGAEEGCRSGLDAIRESASAYESMPKFTFPAECR